MVPPNVLFITGWKYWKNCRLFIKSIISIESNFCRLKCTLAMLRLSLDWLTTVEGLENFLENQNAIYWKLRIKVKISKILINDLINDLIFWFDCQTNCQSSITDAKWTIRHNKTTFYLVSRNQLTLNGIWRIPVKRTPDIWLRSPITLTVEMKSLRIEMKSG